MIRVGAGLCAVAAFLSYTAGAADTVHGERVKAVCAKGNPWRIPAVPAGAKGEAEAGLKVYGPDQKMLLVCNCTPDHPTRNATVILESDDPSEHKRLNRQRKIAGEAGSNQPRFPHYVAPGSCAVAGSSLIAIKPGDKTVETWGTFDAFEAK